MENEVAQGKVNGADIMKSTKGKMSRNPVQMATIPKMTRSGRKSAKNLKTLAISPNVSTVSVRMNCIPAISKWQNVRPYLSDLAATEDEEWSWDRISQYLAKSRTNRQWEARGQTRKDTPR